MYRVSCAAPCSSVRSPRRIFSSDRVPLALPLDHDIDAPRRHRELAPDRPAAVHDALEDAIK